MYDVLLQIVELSLQVMKDMESVYFDPSSAHNLHLPLACQSAQGSALSSTAPRNGQSGEANSDIVIGGSTSSPTSPGSPKAGAYPFKLSSLRHSSVFTTNLIAYRKHCVMLILKAYRYL